MTLMLRVFRVRSSNRHRFHVDAECPNSHRGRSDRRGYGGRQIRPVSLDAVLAAGQRPCPYCTPREVVEALEARREAMSGVLQ